MSFHAQSTFNSCQLRHIAKTAPLCVYVYVCVYAYIVIVELLVRGHPCSIQCVVDHFHEIWIVVFHDVAIISVFGVGKQSNVSKLTNDLGINEMLNTLRSRSHLRAIISSVMDTFLTVFVLQSKNEKTYGSNQCTMG